MAITRLVEATLLKGDAKYENGKRTAKRVFYAIFDTPPDDFDDAVDQFKTEASIADNDPLKSGDTRLLKSITPASLGTTTDFVFDLEYETPANETSQSDPNPLMRPDEISVSGGSGTRPYFRDYTTPTAQKLITTAGEPFSTLPENFVGSFELTIKGNRSTFDAATWPTYLRPACAINTNDVTIRGITFAAGTLLMKNMRMAPKFENDVSFYEFEWTLAVADSWDQDIENRGFSELNGDGKPVPILQADNRTPVNAPYPLAADGTKKSIPTDTPYVTTFKPQPAKDFSVFTWSSAA